MGTIKTKFRPTDVSKLSILIWTGFESLNLAQRGGHDSGEGVYNNT